MGLTVELPSLTELREASERLSGTVTRTPVVPLGDDVDTLLKLETLQPIGSFKIRGVYNAVSRIDPARRAAGLSTVSAGNTAQALAWCGRRFGVPARSLMPETAPRSKIDAVRRYGGEPVLVPIEEVFRFLREHGWERESYAFVHPWIERDVMIGHGSLGLELVEQVPDLETVFVPVGGGGLMSGVAGALRAAGSRARVVAVEPEGCPSFHESRKLGRPARVACRTICDGVAVPYITDEMFPVLDRLVDDTVLVSDDAVRECVRRLALDMHIVTEPSGALALAAALAMPAQRRGKTACLVTGGSIDRETLVEILT